MLAQVHEVIRAADDDPVDPGLAACVQLSLAGPRPTHRRARSVSGTYTESQAVQRRLLAVAAWVDHLGASGRATLACPQDGATVT